MLTTVERLKPRLKLLPSDEADDTLLENCIKAVSGRFAKECNRVFGRAENALYEFPADRMEIIPALLPIASVSKWETKEDETAGWVEVSDVRYLLKKFSRAGVMEGSLISLKASLGSADLLARITYTGGYVLPGTEPAEGQIALPDEIEQAAIEQCAYWYQNRDRLGLVSISGDGGAIQQFAQLDLLPSIKPLLKKYERMLL